MTLGLRNKIFIKNRYGNRKNTQTLSIIGKNKETADLFNRYLSKIIGKYELVYTRHENGRKFILKCRTKSYISYNAKKVNNKHKLNNNFTNLFILVFPFKSFQIFIISHFSINYFIIFK